MTAAAQVGFLNAVVNDELSRYETESWVQYKWDTIQREFMCCGGYTAQQVNLKTEIRKLETIEEEFLRKLSWYKYSLLLCIQHCATGFAFAIYKETVKNKKTTLAENSISNSIRY